MAKTILKKTRNAAVVKCYGVGTHTIDLDTDLVVDGQTPSTPKANLARIDFCCPATSTIIVERNLKKLWSMAGPFAATLDFQGFSDHEENASDIVVTITGDASIVLTLKKVEGWGDTQHVNPDTSN